MTCQTCGRPAENGVATHWLGCGELEPRTTPTVRYQGPVPVSRCEHGECAEPKREGSGKGAPPKYCKAHSTPKNRK